MRSVKGTAVAQGAAGRPLAQKQHSAALGVQPPAHWQPWHRGTRGHASGEISVLLPHAVDSPDSPSPRPRPQTPESPSSSRGGNERVPGGRISRSGTVGISADTQAFFTASLRHGDIRRRALRLQHNGGRNGLQATPDLPSAARVLPCHRHPAHPGHALLFTK